MDFTHFNQEGRAKMVDISEKKKSHRVAIASGTVKMKKETLEKVLEGNMKKGDVLNVAQVAGIMGAKKTSDIIPMCHHILIDGIDIEFKVHHERNEIQILARVETIGKTGVEMEALSAVSITALTIYDMCKSIDKGIEITNIHLLEKKGGKSGHYIKKEVKDDES